MTNSSQDDGELERLRQRLEEVEDKRAKELAEAETKHHQALENERKQHSLRMTVFTSQWESRLKKLEASLKTETERAARTQAQLQASAEGSSGAKRPASQSVDLSPPNVSEHSDEAAGPSHSSAPGQGSKRPRSVSTSTAADPQSTLPTSMTDIASHIPPALPLPPRDQFLPEAGTAFPEASIRLLPEGTSTPLLWRRFVSSDSFLLFSRSAAT